MPATLYLARLRRTRSRDWIGRHTLRHQAPFTTFSSHQHIAAAQLDKAHIAVITIGAACPFHAHAAKRQAINTFRLETINGIFNAQILQRMKPRWWPKTLRAGGFRYENSVQSHSCPDRAG